MNPRLDYLLNRLVQRTLEGGERDELMDLITDGGNGQQLEDFVGRVIDEPGEELELPAEPARAILATIFATTLPERGQQRLAPVIALVPTRPRPRGWRVAAAILLIGLAGGGAWLALRHPAETPSTIVVTHELAPGRNRAILTIGNGRRIVLDSTANGLVTNEGQTRIEKTAGGRLAYHPGDGGGSADEPVTYNTLSTPRGGQYELTLPDGSRVWLNALSTVSYPTAFTGSTRTVTLTGEAYFEIKPNPGKPFQVSIDGKETIEVLGTGFDLNAYSDEPTVNTTLVEGAVRVNPVSVTGRPVVLRPGEQARLGTAHVSVEEHADLERVLAWKNGYFSFRGASLEEIMRQVGRWYDAEIVYEGDVKSEQFSGSVPRSANASKLLEVMALTKTVRFEITNKKIIVKPYRP